MRVMSVSEFADWQKTCDRRVFILDTDNNAWLKAQPFHGCLRFPKMIVSPFPGRVAFLDGDNLLCLERVKEVHMYDRRGKVGSVFDVICRTPLGDRQAWRFLAD